MTEAERTFRMQVEAFNAGNLEAFLDTYSADAIISGMPSGPLVGSEALRRHYERRFSRAGVRCDVLDCTTFDDRWVVAHERVTELGEALDVVAIFEIRDGKIARTTSLRGAADEEAHRGVRATGDR
jgi:hypothetical protein